MKYLLSRILLLLLLCFAVEPVSRAAISSRLVTLPTNGSVERWMSDTIARKDTLNTAEAAVKARFDSLERRLSPPVDTVELVKKNSKAVAAPWAASQDLQRQLKKQFVPNPQRALWLSLVIPGGGQIYNRKYWKLPLFYGGFLGCTYAFLWNQQMYMDYSQAYLDIMDDDPLTNSFRNVYLLSVVDAYVDAQLSVFDISPDLSLQVVPATIDTFNGLQRHQSMGIGATLTF